MSSTTFVDTALRKAADYYNNLHFTAYCYGGSAIGQSREITEFAVIGSVTIAPATNPALIATDTFELHYIFTEAEYRRAINMAIEAMANRYLVEIIDDTTITLSADTYEYALPTSLLYLYRVTTEDDVDGDVFSENNVVDPRDWSIVKAYPPQLKLHKDRYGVTASKDLRLEGQGTQALVTGDTDVIYLPTDWIVAEAILNLPSSKVQSNKLDNVYRQAKEDALYYRLTKGNSPDPRAKAIVE